MLQPIEHIRRFQQLLLLFRREERQRRGNKIHQSAGVFDIDGNRSQLVRQGRRLRDNLLELAHHIALQRLGARCRRRLGLLQVFYLRHHERLGLHKPHQPHPFHALGEDKPALIRHANDLVNGGQRPYSVQVGGRGCIDARVDLGGHNNRALIPQRFNQLNRALPANCKRQNSMREKNCIANGKHSNPANTRDGGSGGAFRGQNRRRVRH